MKSKIFPLQWSILESIYLYLFSSLLRIKKTYPPTKFSLHHLVPIIFIGIAWENWKLLALGALHLTFHRSWSWNWIEVQRWGELRHQSKNQSDTFCCAHFCTHSVQLIRKSIATRLWLVSFHFRRLLKNCCKSTFFVFFFNF